jgi:sRNA-binding protein
VLVFPDWASASSLLAHLMALALLASQHCASLLAARFAFRSPHNAASCSSPRRARRAPSSPTDNPSAPPSAIAMLARNLLCRLAADAPTVGPKTATHDLPQLARLLQRTIASRNGIALAYRTALVHHRRSYATAAAVKKPAARKSAATKPTATVKRAVKTTAAAKAAPTKRRVTAKKTAPKKAAPKKKPAAKRKPVAKKASKKVANPEKDYKLETRNLKKIALRDPSHVAMSAWHAFVREVVKGTTGTGSAQEAITSAGTKFKALTPAEKEVLPPTLPAFSLYICLPVFVALQPSRQ